MAKTYTVKKGDTLSAIARKYSTTVDAILKANPFIINKNIIHAGWVLALPGASAGTNEPVKDYAAIGAAVEKCVQKIETLPEFKALEALIYGIKN